MSAAIRVEGLRHAYAASGHHVGWGAASEGPRRPDERDVLSGLSFEVAPGSIFGFVGANGAGKTTTIRVLATLLEPREGRALVGGFDVVREPREVRRILGFMPDQARIDDLLTVSELLDFYAAAHGLGGEARKRAVAATLELCGLGPLRDRLANGLSKGMRQRVLLARTLLHDPAVLVLDEPASDLDPRARIELRELLLEVRAMGKTILLSSHILSELEQICDAVAIIERGHLVATGPMSTLGQGAAAAAAHPTGCRAVRLRFLGGAAQVAETLARLPDVAVETVDARGAALHPTGCTLLVRCAGGDARLAELVRSIVEQGGSLVGVEPERTHLEATFLELTKGELQ